MNDTSESTQDTKDTEPLSPEIAKVWDDDKKWFLARPGAKCRTRPFADGEVARTISSAHATAELFGLLEELKDILTHSVWRARILSMVIQLSPGDLVGIPILEVAEGKTLRNVVLWNQSDGSYREVAADTVITDLRGALRWKKEQRETKEAPVICTRCMYTPQPGEPVAFVGRKLHCRKCVLHRIKYGMSVKSARVGIVTMRSKVENATEADYATVDALIREMDEAAGKV